LVGCEKVPQLGEKLLAELLFEVLAVLASYRSSCTLAD
jgi:hypothetical protein